MTMTTSSLLLCLMAHLWLQPGYSTPLPPEQAGLRNNTWEGFYRAPTTHDGPTESEAQSSPATFPVPRAVVAWPKPVTGRPEDGASLLPQEWKSLQSRNHSKLMERPHSVSTTATTFREGRVLHRGGNNFVEGLQVRVTAPPFRVRPAASSTGTSSEATSTPSTRRTTHPPQPSKTTHKAERSTISQSATGLDTRDEELLDLLPQLIEAARYRLQKNGRAEVPGGSGASHSDVVVTPSLTKPSTLRQSSPTDASRLSATTLAASPQQKRERRICMVFEGNEDTLGSALLRALSEALQRRTDNEPVTAGLVERIGGTLTPYREAQQQSREQPSKASIARHNAASKGKDRRERGNKFKTPRAGRHPENDETNAEVSSTDGYVDDEPNRGGRMAYFSDRIQQHWDQFVGQVKTVAKETWDHLAQQMARSIEVLVQ